MSKKLKKGYSTGVHTAIAFMRALEAFLYTNDTVKTTTVKMPNDDIDMTIGAKIEVIISHSKELLNLNKTAHKPYIHSNMQIYAGSGVGVVTKDGLKAPKGYPAINPKPLSVICEIYDRYGKNREIFVSVGVEKGEEIAKNTANEKVGVKGGISILGTTGWVKPVSSSAYIDSVETEIKVAKADGYKEIIFTIGSSSKDKALQSFDDTQIVEIGNFVYDSVKLAQKEQFNKLIIFCGMGKAVKIAQGFKNTHNRYGSIDLKRLQNEFEQYSTVSLDIDGVKTVKGVYDRLDSDIQKLLYEFIYEASLKQLKEWVDMNIDIDIVI